MRILLFALLFVCLLPAQAPRIGNVEFYGLRRLSVERLNKILQLQPGDPLPRSKGDVEERLESIPGVVQARLEAVCCDGGKAILFVGIAERSAPHFAFRSEPAGAAALPAEIVTAYARFMEAVQSAVRRGNTAEDLTHGHGLMADTEARAWQNRFAGFAKDRLPLLRDVLRTGSDAEQRAIAAAVIGYASEKKAVIDDLQYAMQDPDEAVRANAMRALNAIAVLAIRQPELGVRVASTWFVEMLNSIVLSDRIRAATALVTLTDKNGAATLQQVRERARDAVLEMARWHALDYALPSFMLAGRMAGLTDKEIEDAWTKGNREAVLAKVPPAARRQ